MVFFSEIPVSKIRFVAMKIPRRRPRSVQPHLPYMLFFLGFLSHVFINFSLFNNNFGMMDKSELVSWAVSTADQRATCCQRLLWWVDPSQAHGMQSGFYGSWIRQIFLVFEYWYLCVPVEFLSATINQKPTFWRFCFVMLMITLPIPVALELSSLIRHTQIQQILTTVNLDY